MFKKYKIRVSSLEKTEYINGGIVTSESGFWILTNDPRFNGDELNNKHGFMYSWAVLQRFDETQGYTNRCSLFSDHRITFSFLSIYEFNKPKLGEVIITDKLFKKIDGKSITCNKKELAGIVSINLDYLFHENGKNVILNLPSSERSPNCFDLRMGEVSYYMGIQSPNENGKWGRDGRQVMKATKFISMLHPFFEGERDLFDRATELFAENLKSDGIYNIRVSDEPDKIYAIRTSKGPTGSLGSSCMNAESSHDGKEFMNFYNMMGAKIAYILDANDDRLCSRALLWDEVWLDDDDDNYSSKSFKFMDRIYGTENHIAAMKEWAEENGYYVKQEQSYSNTTLIKEDCPSYTRFYVKHDRKWYDFEGIPYVDTLSNWENDNINSYSGDDLQCTDGNTQNQHHIECEQCGASIDEDDAIYVDDYHYCDNCTVYSNYYNEYVVYSECTKTSKYGWIRNDDSDFVEIDGEMVHINDCYCCQKCNEYGLNLTEVHVGGRFTEAWCDDCVSEYASNCDDCDHVHKNELLTDGLCETCKVEVENV